MNDPSVKTESVNSNNIFFLIYFFTTFFGGKLFLEEYLFVDDLPVVYSMILGLASALISGIVIYFVKRRQLFVKIIAGGLVLAFTVIVNILIT